MGLDESVQNIAGALKPSNQEPSARWRWGTVESVSEYGTMNVNVAGTSLMGIRAAQHCMGAQVGDRVRVAYYGTDAVVDAVRASSALMSVPSPSMDADTQAAWLDALGISELFHFETVTTATQSVGSGSVVEFTATAPTIDGWTCRGALQAWTSGTGTTIVGMPWRTSEGNVIRIKVRGNVASNVSVGVFLLYTPDALTTVG